ncbi:MAG: MFS transporter [Thermoprotei archaeon]
MSQKGLAASLALLVLMTVSFRATNNMVGTTLPLVAKYELGFSATLVGLLSAVYMASNLFVNLFVNPRLSLGTATKLFVIASWANVALLPLFYLSDQLTVWVVSLASGFVNALLVPLLMTYASTAPDRERAMNLYSTALSLSLILGPLYETVLLTKYGYSDVFLFFVPVALILAVLSFRVRMGDGVKTKARRSPGAHLRNPGLISAILAITTYNVPFAAITAFSAILVEERFHVSSFEAYSVYLPFYLASFATRLFMTVRPFEDLRRPLIVSVVLTLVSLVGQTFATSYAEFLAFYFVLGIPHGSVFPMATVLITRASRLEERVALNSYFMAYNNALFIAVPPFVGLLSDCVGLSYAFASLTVVVAVSAIALAKYMKLPFFTSPSVGQ